MSLQERVQTDIAAAMRSGDSLRRDTLRMVASAAYNVEKRDGHPLSDAEYLDVIARETAEIEIISAYLPAALTDDELQALVDEAVTATGATSPRDMGKVMGWLSPRTKNRADGRHLSELVAKALASADLAAHDQAH